MCVQDFYLTCVGMIGMCFCELGLQVAFLFHKWAMRLSEKNYGAFTYREKKFGDAFMKKSTLRLQKC